MNGDFKVYTLAAINGGLATAQSTVLSKLETVLQVSTSVAQLAVAVVTVIFIVKKIRKKDK